MEGYKAFITSLNLCFDAITDNIYRDVSSSLFIVCERVLVTSWGRPLACERVLVTLWGSTACPIAGYELQLPVLNPRAGKVSARVF